MKLNPNLLLASLLAVFLLSCSKESDSKPREENGPIKGEIQIRVDGGAWQKRVAGPAVKFREGYYAIADLDSDEVGSSILIRWMGGIGTHAYKAIGAAEGTHAHYLIDDGNNYVPYYVTETGMYVSGGGVTITTMGEKDGFIEGTFLMDPAGYGDALMQQAKIEGKFRVKKGW
ncbi:hypothetical protein [uncultured Chitinophaga sp.]|uniref:hypothetical protein n=1 Tax=uncultured Chitinophaga sp. TaxID=339340 RepID=UPI0025E61989|nr:hypothetical protein [uncultured Chitinophaga sp.]